MDRHNQILKTKNTRKSRFWHLFMPNFRIPSSVVKLQFTFKVKISISSCSFGKETRPSRPKRCDVWIVEQMRYRPTDRSTDTASYRGALSHLKTAKTHRETNTEKRKIESGVTNQSPIHKTNSLGGYHNIGKRSSFLEITNRNVRKVFEMNNR